MKKLIIFVILVVSINAFAQIPTSGLIGYWPFNGNANDQSGNGNNGTVTGAVLSLDRFGNPDNAYTFNGLNSFISILNSPNFNTNMFTISIWANIGSCITPTPTPDLFMITKGQWRIYHQGYYTPNEDSVSLINDIFTSNGRFITSDIIKINQWCNIVFINDGTKIKLFYNGIMVSSALISAAINNTTENINIGARNQGSEGFYVGQLDDIRIYNKALSNSEVLSIYNENMCSDTTINITTDYHVTDAGFETISPRTYLESTDSLTRNIGGCDSIVNHYSKYVFQANYCTDTITTMVYDTIAITIYDSISVTDTLIIKVLLTGVNPPNSINKIKIYPNPASTHIYIDNGDYGLMPGYVMKITNSIGQSVFEQPINKQKVYVDLSTWCGKGTYFVAIIDSQGNLIDSRKIILQ